MELFEYIDLLRQPFDIFYTNSVQSRLHWHYYSEILYVKKGSILLICNERRFLLEADDLCYIYPMHLHEIQKGNDEEVCYAVIKFDIHTIHIPKAYIQKMFDYFVRRASDEDHCILVKNLSAQDEPTVRCIGLTVEEYTKKQDFYMLQIQANIFSILIAMSRMCSQKPPLPQNGRSDRTVSFSHILEYIDVHSAEHIEIRELAEKCHLSYSHFARLFREQYGRSCKEYITYIRLNKADELLMHTDYDIAYIANETGFFDSSHFICAYKKWKGITPRQQRLIYAGSRSER